MSLPDIFSNLAVQFPQIGTGGFTGTTQGPLVGSASTGFPAAGGGLAGLGGAFGGQFNGGGMGAYTGAGALGTFGGYTSSPFGASGSSLGPGDGIAGPMGGMMSGSASGSSSGVGAAGSATAGMASPGFFGAAPDPHAGTSYVPGIGYIPNSNMQSDSRGSWIGAGPGMAAQSDTSGMGSAYGMPANPYLGGQAQDITDRTQRFLDTNLAGINSNAVGTGALGGSRQGVAQGGAIGQAADTLSGNLASLYGNNWNQDQNRALQQYQGDQNFYTNQRSLDYTGLNTGANLYNLGINGQWSPINNANNVYGKYTGFGSSDGTSTQGGGWPGAVGGAVGMANFGHQQGWW